MQRYGGLRDYVITCSYPKVNEIFELTLDGLEVQPIEMLWRDGYNLDGWTHRGSVISGREIRRFKLVELDYSHSFEDLRSKLGSHGRIPEGQWREAFKAFCPDNRDRGRIGVADASWVYEGKYYFPFLRGRGYSRFCGVVGPIPDNWCWLVEVNEK